MAEFLLELFSEEIPANLQSTARINLLSSFKKFFEKENIIYKEDGKAFSTPNRLVLCFKKIEKEIHQKSEEIRGPNAKAPDKGKKQDLLKAIHFIEMIIERDYK